MIPIRSALRERSSLDWILLASMVALAYNTHGIALPLAVFLALVMVGYIRPWLLRQWWVWASIAAVQGAVQAVRWEGIDDHVIVGTYWALAVALGLLINRPEKVMCISAQWMVGLIFLFAAAWKLASPGFRDGSFFTLYLLADPRFRVVSDLVGGANGMVFDENRRLIGSLYEVGGNAAQVHLRQGPRIGALARAMTVWGLAIESLLAVSWLAPVLGRAVTLRHLALLAFCVTTYGLVAITGFGAILLVMGMATTQDGSLWRKSYAIGLVALSLWTPLWRMIGLS